MGICESKSNSKVNLPNNTNENANTSNIGEKKILNYDYGRYEGNVINGKAEGKGILYLKNGDRYEGDFKNDIMEGKGIYYYKNGDREMGDYLNNKKVGKHITLTINGNVKTNNYD